MRSQTTTDPAARINVAPTTAQAMAVFRFCPAQLKQLCFEPCEKPSTHVAQSDEGWRSAIPREWGAFCRECRQQIRGVWALLAQPPNALRYNKSLHIFEEGDNLIQLKSFPARHGLNLTESSVIQRLCGINT